MKLTEHELRRTRIDRLFILVDSNEIGIRAFVEEPEIGSRYNFEGEIHEVFKIKMNTYYRIQVVYLKKIN